MSNFCIVHKILIETFGKNQIKISNKDRMPIINF